MGVKHHGHTFVGAHPRENDHWASEGCCTEKLASQFQEICMSPESTVGDTATEALRASSAGFCLEADKRRSSTLSHEGQQVRIYLILAISEGLSFFCFLFQRHTGL